jgi:hypothetical protein
MGLAALGVRGAGCPVLSVVATTPPGTDARRTGVAATVALGIHA